MSAKSKQSVVHKSKHVRGHRPHIPIAVRNTKVKDFPQIIELCRRVYPTTAAWDPQQLGKHLELFPEGQFVAVQEHTGRVVGMAASLIVRWDEYEHDANWREFTDRGWFTNHDPDCGRTLYGAEVMVDPATQGQGVGKKIYAARRELCRRLGLARIRAGSRLRGYGRHADEFSVEQYVISVINGELRDPTLTFQLRQGFRVISLTESYLMNDPESRGAAAVIEWLNDEVATESDRAAQEPRFRPRHA